MMLRNLTGFLIVIVAASGLLTATILYNERLSYSLPFPEECETTCWQGITPADTTGQEALEELVRRGLIRPGEERVEPYPRIFVYLEPLHLGPFAIRAGVVELHIDNDIVQGIVVYGDSNITLREFFAVLEEPHQAVVIRDYDADRAHLLYPDRGIEVTGVTTYGEPAYTIRMLEDGRYEAHVSAETTGYISYRPPVKDTPRALVTTE